MDPSFLGLRKCDLLDLDLTRLIGGLNFLIPYTLSINGIGTALKPLADTRANDFLFINRPLAVHFSESISA